MKRRIVITLISSFVLILGTSTIAMAGEGYSFRSKGKLVFDNGTTDTSDDVIFDATDLSVIETEVTDGKAAIKDAINTAVPNKITDSNPTFESLKDAIPEIFEAGKEEGKAEGSSTVWDDISSDTELIARGYDNVSDLESLKAAIIADNKSNYNDGLELGKKNGTFTNYQIQGNVSFQLSCSNGSPSDTTPYVISVADGKVTASVTTKWIEFQSRRMEITGIEAGISSADIGADDTICDYVIKGYIRGRMWRNNDGWIPLSISSAPFTLTIKDGVASMAVTTTTLTDGSYTGKILSASSSITSTSKTEGLNVYKDEIAKDLDLAARGYDTVSDLASLKAAITADNESYASTSSKTIRKVSLGSSSGSSSSGSAGGTRTFSATSLPGWQTMTTQNFGVEVTYGGSAYPYKGIYVSGYDPTTGVVSVYWYTEWSGNISFTCYGYYAE